MKRRLVYGAFAATSIASMLGCWGAATAAAERPVTFPLQVSDDGRYLVDSAGVPFFVHADTAWQAPKRLTTKVFEEYLTQRASLGFNTVFLHTFSREVTPDANHRGDRPFDPPDDIGSPNEPYWRQLDDILQKAEDNNFFVAIAPLWIRWGGSDTAGWRIHFREELAGRYGEFLGRRYAAHKNIMWILGGDANPQEKTKAIDLLARGIKRTAPHHLLTVHNRPDNSSAAFFDAAPWLDVNLAYSYRETYIHVGGEWNRLGKRRPIVLGESGYEEESNDGRGGAPQRVRRQAYSAILSGALGGHAFGNAHLWRMDERWREALNSPASRQMAHVQALFRSIPWHRLVPDDNYPPPPAEFADVARSQKDQLLLDGRGLFGDDDYASAARATDGSVAVVYLPVARRVTVNFDRLTGTVTASWFDPTDGSTRPAGPGTFRGGAHTITPDDRNAAGDSDWVLVLKSKTP